MVFNVNSKQNAVLPIPSISNNDDQQMSDIPRQKKLLQNLHLIIYMKFTVQQGK